MKKSFVITVNQQRFDISIEDTPQNKKADTPAKNAKKKSDAETIAETLSRAGDSQVEKAPMPGTIVEVRVKPGYAVSRGQTLVVLEAMKMENEIPSKVDGVVTEVMVKKGDAVATGAPLVAISAR